MFERATVDRRLYLRGKVYWLWGYDANGKRWFASTKQTHKPAAREVAKTIDTRRAIPINPAEEKARGLTLGEAFVELVDEGKRRAWAPNTHRIKVSAMRHLLQVLGADTLATSLTLETTNHYFDTRIAEGAGTIKQRHTIFKELQVLILALKHAKSLGRYRGNPSELMPAGLRSKHKRYKPGSGWLKTTAECDALVDSMERLFDRGLDVLGYLNTGVRASELYSFTREDVHGLDGVRPWVLIRGTKTKGAERPLSLNRTMVAVLRSKLATARPGEPVFTPSHGLDRQLKLAWQHARASLLRRGLGTEASLPRSISCNDLRRTFVSTLCRAGVPAHACADLLGHESVDMVMGVYRQVDPQSLHDAVARMPTMSLPGTAKETCH